MKSSESTITLALPAARLRRRRDELEFLPAALEIVIVPGLAFDAQGRRLGSGAGYYDGTFQGRRPGGPRHL